MVAVNKLSGLTLSDYKMTIKNSGSKFHHLHKLAMEVGLIFVQWVEFIFIYSND